jgi:hypothetical protein
MTFDLSFIRKNISYLLPQWMTIVGFMIIYILPVDGLVLFWFYIPLYFYLFLRAYGCLYKAKIHFLVSALHLIFIPFIFGVMFFVFHVLIQIFIGINIYTVFRH